MPPRVSGLYLTYVRGNHSVYTMNFSSHYGKFNADDITGDRYAMEVDLWAHVPADTYFVDYRTETGSDDKIKNIEALVDARNRYDEIVTIKDLRYENLTLTEYQMVGMVLTDIEQNGIADTFCNAVAGWFRLRGFDVKVADDGVNYTITC